MGYFDKTYHPPGTPPGTLVGSEGVTPEKFTIRLFDYTDSGVVEEIVLDTADECQPYLHKDSITWIHLQGSIQPDTMQKIGNIFELHPLALEDVLNKGQRPKMEEYDDQVFVIMTMPEQLDDTTLFEQVSIFLGENYIISFHSGKQDPFGPLYERLRKKGGRISSHKADYLLYFILDLVIDKGFPLLESFSEDVERIEEELLRLSSTQSILADIHHLRRELLILKRNLWPQRDVVSSLLRSENKFIKDDTFVYLRDCYDHTILILDLIENYRDIAANLIDIYLSSSSRRLNEIMQILTMIATIFIPLTFITGLYGMNFSHPDSPWAMPELHWYYGYPLIWGVIIVIAIGMVIYFKRKNWL